MEHNSDTLQSQGADWKVEVRRAAGFVMRYWALLGVGALTLSVIAMHSYLVGEAIPLSITSPDVVAGLPALFILITYAVFILTCSAALPSMILLSRSKVLSRSLIEDMLLSDSGCSYREHKVRLRLTIFWSLGLIVSSIIVISFLYWPAFLSLVGYSGLFVIAILLFSLSLVLAARPNVTSGLESSCQRKMGWVFGIWSHSDIRHDQPWGNC